MRSASKGSLVTAWSGLMVEASSSSTPSLSTLTRAPSNPRITGRAAPAPKLLERTPGKLSRVSPSVASRRSTSSSFSITATGVVISWLCLARPLALTTTDCSSTGSAAQAAGTRARLIAQTRG